MHIVVLGGGISGITTATLLQARGHRTTLLTSSTPHQQHGADYLRFASLYPAASVIPHTVHVKNEARHTRWSQQLFDVFCGRPGWGVRIQRHAELFETPPPRPDYLDALRRLTLLPEDGRGRPGLPQRGKASGLYGWLFDMTFVEAPTYMRKLYALYNELGGCVQRQHLTRDRCSEWPGDLWVNCLGYAAPHLFEDKAPAAYRHGHLLHVRPPASATTWREASPIASYNYEPAYHVYPAPGSTPGGIYFYPRQSVWVVGGTKHPANEHGAYTAPLREPTVRVHGVVIPKAMWDLNAALISSMTGADIRSLPVRVVSGLRYVRDPDGKGVRLSWEDTGGRPVVHNYGHGGAGVTLSWSAALHVARTIEAKSKSPTLRCLSHPIAGTLCNASQKLLEEAPASE